MTMTEVELWIIHTEREIFVTDFVGGIPVAVTTYVSEDAKRAAEERGGPTISEIGFDAGIHHSFDNWESAMSKAREFANQLGYRINTHSWMDYPDDDDDFNRYDGYDDEYDDWEDDDDA